jgi:uncharacterized protein (TIGR00730 family)
VTGGGGIGLMRVVAEGALDEGGRVIGVIPKALVERELAHPGLTELVVVDSMHERKARMTELGDAFVALPGGFGTLDETFEALTWAQLGIHRKPIVLLDVMSYWSPLLAAMDSMVQGGFVSLEHRGLVRTARDETDLFERALADVAV